MKKSLILTSLFASICLTSFGQTFSTIDPFLALDSPVGLPKIDFNPCVEVRVQKGYVKRNGTYVEPHVKTVPNHINWDNFSTYGNINPFTLERGSRALDYSLDALNYGQGRVIFEGPRGGQYYYNDRGNKTYVPKRGRF